MAPVRLRQRLANVCRLHRAVPVAAAAWAVVAMCATTLPAEAPWGSARTLSASLMAQTRAPAATEAEARAFCGTACHTFPPPDILPKAAWRDELVRMQLLMDGIPEPAGSLSVAAVMIPLPPEMLKLLRYYEANAPAALEPPAPWPAPEAGPVSFTSSTVSIKGHPDLGGFAVANVGFIDLDGDQQVELVAADMRAGLVLAGPVDGPLIPIADIPHPSRVHATDLDKDGQIDLLVSDLGSFQPADHHAGGIYWLRRSPDGRYATIKLAADLGRVADARAGDMDGDGDLDIVAAVFGWRKTGSVVLFENRTTNWTTPQFVPRVLDPRTGAIDVPIADINGDGTPDIVALLAQEHETVIALLNDGKGRFTTETIFAAPHPNWGSSGIQLVDFRKTGRLDVLHTHGDTFDDFLLKPYHGVTLLENNGSYPFTPRTLAALPGAYRAVAVDVDRDGDLDVVAAAMVAGGGKDILEQLPGVVWLEQVRSDTFVRHTIERGRPFHATLDAMTQADGTVRIATGAFVFGMPMDAPIYVWQTSGRAGTTGPTMTPPQ